ncbi:MAG: DUF982 domain-containing protein [Rhizobium sp.]|nr:MAG: DUF982 domain-containing protein [Rhizobium sp.]
MPNKDWNTPVEISFRAIGSEAVNGPFEALIVLTDRWPDRSGLNFIKARNACRAAIAGRRNSEEARCAFLAAAREAKLTPS